MANLRPDHIIYGDVDYANPVNFTRRPYYQRRCSIMVTLTDSQVTVSDLQKMMEAGMNMTRFKMINHTKDDKIQILSRIREAAKACCKKFGVADWPITTSIELKTRIMRTGVLEEGITGGVTLKEGAEVILTNNIKFFDKCNAQRIFVDNTHLTDDTKVGSEIYVACDEIMLTCKQIIDDKSIKCVVVVGGKLYNTATVSIRGINYNRPLLNERDLERLQFAVDYKVDLITINYVDHKDTIIKARKIIAKNKDQQPLILSGICTEQGLDSIDDILKVSDAIVLSREFLPYELHASNRYRLNNIQKWVAAKCQQVGKPLYLSGAVFVHALHTGVFKDAEVADISNAILDGFAGFILRDCDNVEKTVKTIKFLDEICCSVDPYNASSTGFWQLTDQIKLPINAAEACLMSCVAMANHVQARAIVLPTMSGRTARTLLWMRPTCLVLAVCTSQKVTRMLHLYKTIMPILYPKHGDDDSDSYTNHASQEIRINFAVEYGVKIGWLTYGDIYVCLQRSSEFSCYCDLVGVLSVAISNKPLVECTDDSFSEFV